MLSRWASSTFLTWVARARRATRATPTCSVVASTSSSESSPSSVNGGISANSSSSSNVPKSLAFEAFVTTAWLGRVEWRPWSCLWGWLGWVGLKNLQNLVKVGENLLKKPVSRINLQTGVFEALNKGTNEEALKRLADTLSKEKRLRDLRSPTGHVPKRQK
ncbi:unnamed protein product [Coffea canephora]|uniref:Uncharacterized protein n=1 Tax=Coffea canephora TaxID=49390 RepID=A0A068US09_COFCA|nr:unnamed protein product [Coffea canephora]